MDSGSRATDQHDDRSVILQNSIFILYSDGSFERLATSDVSACSQFVNSVASKDVDLDPSAGIWARLFLPEHVAHSSIKVPLVLHFHGGGFCMGSPASPYFHDFCARMAAASRCIWMSLNYRLAPEHPLPAAYDDAYSALLWLHSQASAKGDSWLAQHADFSKCFLVGESAGGNIVHFAAARAAGRNWDPVIIKGLLLIHAGFVKGKRDGESETEAFVTEFFRRSTLPPGSGLGGHPWMNPMHPDAPKLAEIALPPVFVAVAEKDGLRNAAVEYYDVLKQAGKEAQLFESEGEGHCFHLFQQRGAAAELLETQMIRFIERLS